MKTIAVKPASAGVVRKQRLISQQVFRRTVFPWLLLVPTVVLNLLVVVTPAAQALYYSCTEWKGLGEAKWVGLANYKRMFQDTEMAIGIGNNLRWMVMSMIFPIVIALAVATLVSRTKKAQRLFRVIFFIPVVITSTVSAAVWKNMYDPFVGVGVELSKLGLKFMDMMFLGNPRIALYAVYFAALWSGWGFQMVIYLAALQQIDITLYEAARVDGANRWQQFWNITIPGIRPTLVFMLLMTAMGSLYVFNYIYLMTGGGPGYSTQVIAYKLYQEAFMRFRAGYGSAIGLTLSLFCAGFIAVFIIMRRRGLGI